MKIIVTAFDLVVSGTTVNAIELSAKLRDDYGHDIVFFAATGPMLKLVQEKRLRYFPAPAAKIHPSLTRMRALRNLVKSERPDVIHAWDWCQCVDAFYIEHMLMRVPLIVTDMSMSLQRILPKSLLSTFGTPELLNNARASGYRNSHLLLPPVDVQQNSPAAVPLMDFRDICGIKDGEIVLVLVSRLDACMKAEGVFRTIDAVRTIGRGLPIKFLIVGDGDARAEVERLASEVNAVLGRTAVMLVGAMLDPRPAYAAADIVIGMGGSALRGMAFAKPTIIVGECGFSSIFNPSTSMSFYYSGIYGRGSGGQCNDELVSNIFELASKLECLPALGEFSRKFVIQHFSTELVSADLDRMYSIASVNVPPFSKVAIDGIRTAAIWLRERRFFGFFSRLQQQDLSELKPETAEAGDAA